MLKFFSPQWQLSHQFYIILFNAAAVSVSGLNTNYTDGAQERGRVNAEDAIYPEEKTPYSTSLSYRMQNGDFTAQQKIFF
jgi:hypothetical protein